MLPQTSSSRLSYMLRQNPTYGRSGPGCASTRRHYALSREGTCDGVRGHPIRSRRAPSELLVNGNLRVEHPLRHASSTPGSRSTATPIPPACRSTTKHRIVRCRGIIAAREQAVPQSHSTTGQIAGLEAQERGVRATGCERIFSEQVSSVAEREQLEAALD